MVIGTEQAEASQVVITEAVRIVDGGTHPTTKLQLLQTGRKRSHRLGKEHTTPVLFHALSTW